MSVPGAHGPTPPTVCSLPLSLTQVAADREALKKDYERIQQMVRWWWESPFKLLLIGGRPLFVQQVEERDRTLAGLDRVTSDLDSQRKKAQKDVSGCLPWPTELWACY